MAEGMKHNASKYILIQKPTGSKMMMMLYIANAAINLKVSRVSN
jgi:hypothetical protein